MASRDLRLKLPCGIGCASVCVLVDATMPSGYHSAHLEPGRPWTYPIDEQLSLTAMTIEVAVTSSMRFARVHMTIWTRAVCLSLLHFGAVFCFGILGIHATREYFDHVGYLWFASVFVILFAIGSGAAHLVDRHRKLASAGS